MTEIPMIEFTAWTEKDLRQNDIIEKLINIFINREDFFVPITIYGGEGTKIKNQPFNKNSIKDLELFKKCMINKKVLTICLSNNDKEEKEIYFGFTIGFAPKFSVISFDVSNTYFKTLEEKEKFKDIVVQIIKTIDPIYANIDDISNSLNIMDKMGEDGYKVFEYIPAIFWGNYFGHKYIEKYGKEKLLNIPNVKKQEISNGIMITMTEDLLEFDSKECKKGREKLRKKLHVGRYIIFKKFLRVLKTVRKILE